MMAPDDHRHGTYAGAQAHIRTRTPLAECPPCHSSFLRYRRQRRYDAAMGKPRMVDTALVVKHLKGLREQGCSVRAIAAASGVSDSLIDELLNRTRPVIRADNAAALIATNPPPTPTGMVPALGTIRRIRALGRLGWSQRAVAEASGVKLETLRRINSVEPPHVEFATDEGVRAAYGRLCMTLPPADRTAGQVRARAVKKGWPPPLAWDDIDTDVEPKGGVYLAADRATTIRELAGQGENATHIARRLGIRVSALERWCLNHLPDVWRVISAREGDWNSTGNAARDTRRGAA